MTMASMSEARVRFLTAVKAHYTARYHQGWLSSMGLRVLKVMEQRVVGAFSSWKDGAW